MNNSAIPPAISSILHCIRSNALSELPRLIKITLQEESNNFDHLFNIAVACIENNLFNTAELIFNELLIVKREDSRIFYNLGLLHTFSRDYKKALHFYQKALEINPIDPDALTNMGAILNKLNRYKDANIILAKAIEINPNQPYSWQNKGYALFELNLFEQSLVHFDHAIALDPYYRDAWFNRGNTLEKLNRYEDAYASFQKALLIDPSDSLAMWGLVFATIPALFSNINEKKLSRELFSNALIELNKWIDKNQNLLNSVEAIGSHQPFYLAYQETNNRELLSQYGKICRRVMKKWQDPKLTDRAIKGRRIAIGIVTNHILNHSVWNTLIKGWLQNLNRDLFEIHLFYVSGYSDQETVLAKSISTSFTENLGNLEDWAKAILEKQVDVLIYPEIGMDPLTCKLANLRLAPLQLASWGHPETTGLPTIDYYISAKDFEPTHADDHYSEQLVQLPNLGCYYSARNVTPADIDLLSLGIDKASPILLCPGTPFKYAPEHDKVLVSIAQKLPTCQLILFENQESSLSAALKDRLSKAFEYENLNAFDYLRFIPWQKTEDFYGLMQKSDVFLDTIGFSGFNTAIQAIECGLPIVTREGLFLRGRLASGILRRMGVTELIASNEAEYVDLVVKLVQDRDYRKSVQEKIIANKPVLFDDLEPIRALEQFLVERVNVNKAG